MTHACSALSGSVQGRCNWTSLQCRSGRGRVGWVSLHTHLAPFDDWTTSPLASKHRKHLICHSLCANFSLNSYKTPHFPTWEVEINSHLRQNSSHFCYGGPLSWYMTWFIVIVRWSYWRYGIGCFLRLIPSFRLYRLCSYIDCKSLNSLVHVVGRSPL